MARSRTGLLTRIRTSLRIRLRTRNRTSPRTRVRTGLTAEAKTATNSKLWAWDRVSDTLSQQMRTHKIGTGCLTPVPIFVCTYSNRKAAPDNIARNIRLYIVKTRIYFPLRAFGAVQ